MMLEYKIRSSASKYAETPVKTGGMLATEMSSKKIEAKKVTGSGDHALYTNGASNGHMNGAANGHPH